MTKKMCAMCETKPVAEKFKPFCSKRCADVDLSRWLKGSYAIPGRPSDQVDDTPGNAIETDS